MTNMSHQAHQFKTDEYNKLKINMPAISTSSSCDPAAHRLLPFTCSVTYNENDMCFSVGRLYQKECSVCQVARGGIFLLDLLILCSRTSGVQLSLL